MMHNYTKRFGHAALLIGGLLIVGGSVSVANAQSTKPKATTTKRSTSGRDPFKKYEPPKAVVKRVAGEAPVPSIQERINLYKAQKQAAMRARMPAPKPTTALLLSEIQVIGISRTPRGYAAIVEATPIKLSYVIYPGEPFYDGQLVAIEDTGLVFRQETVFVDGRRERTSHKKFLRQPNSVSPMTPVSVSAAPQPQNESVAAAKP
jgi:hypothetical protein